MRVLHMNLPFLTAVEVRLEPIRCSDAGGRFCSRGNPVFVKQFEMFSQNVRHITANNIQKGLELMTLLRWVLNIWIVRGIKPKNVKRSICLCGASHILD